MHFAKSNITIISKSFLFCVALIFLASLHSNKAISSDEKSQGLTSGPFNLSGFWNGELVSGGSVPEIHSISVNQKAAITQGGNTVAEGQDLVFSYNPDNPVFSIGGGTLSDKNANGGWTDSLISASDCPANTIGYTVGEPISTYDFKLCGIKPAVEVASGNPAVITCSGMSCHAVSPGSAHIEAIIGETSLKAWGNSSVDNNWNTLATVSLSSTTIAWDITVAPQPIIDFLSVSQTIPYETGTDLSWNSQYADSCVAADGWSGSKPVSGIWNTGNLYGTKKYTLSCTGSGGTTTKSITIVVGPPNPPPTLNFYASALSIEQNTATTLIWSASNAALCLASGNWSGTKDFTGSESTGNLAENKTYILTCSNSAGSISKYLPINIQAPDIPAPTLTFSADKISVPSGQSATLSWSSSNASSCTASDDWSGGKDLSGNENTGNISSNKRYTLSCVGQGGSISQTVNITTYLMPELDFTVDSTNILYNQTTTLRWNSTNTTTCKVVTNNNSWSATLALSGARSTPIMTSSKTYILTCSGLGGVIQKSILVTVDAPLADPILTFSASSYNLPFNSVASLSWTSQNSQICTASGNWSGSKGLSGSYSTGYLLASKTYILTCSSSVGSISRSITINIDPPPQYDAVPIFEFWADRYSLYTGQATTLRWTTTNATFCTASGSWSGLKGLNGSTSTNNLSSTKTYILTCGNNAGTISRFITITVSSPDPTLNFSADSMNVAYNTSTILRWQASNATTCFASDGWNGTKTLSGNELTINLTEGKNYQLTCQNSFSTITKTINIQVGSMNETGPSVSLWADSFIVSSGTSTTLRWASENAFSCVASGDWIGNKSIVGSLGTGSLATPKDYILTCSDTNGLSSSMRLRIGIGTQAESLGLSFWADSINVNPNSPVTLHWKSQNTTNTCVASGGWSGEKMLSGNETILPITTSKKYELSCSGPGGMVTAYVSVSVGASFTVGPEINFWADSYNIPSGTSTSLRWTSINTSSCIASSANDSGWNGSLESFNSGSYETGAVTQSASYTITCYGYGGQASAQITIIPSTLLICPVISFITVGTSANLVAYYQESGSFSCDDTSGAQEISTASWSSTSPDIISIDATGQITGHVISGPVEISANYKGLSATSNISVIPVLVDCWTCDNSTYSCSSSQSTACTSDQYSSETSCAEKCRDFSWHEASP